MLTIKRIGKLGRLHASEITQVSDLMGRANHIFAVVPKAEIEARLDWR